MGLTPEIAEPERGGQQRRLIRGQRRTGARQRSSSGQHRHELRAQLRSPLPGVEGVDRVAGFSGKEAM